MQQSNQQKYYDEHYSISEGEAWKTWQPNPLLSSKEISEFCINSNAQETVLAIISAFAPFKSTLDVGCSAGDFIIPISKASVNSYGVDIVDFSIAWPTVSKQFNNIHFSKLNLDESNLPFNDSSFDLVTMMMVLEHVFDVHHAVKEVSRVLAPDGIAVIQVPNIGYIKNRFDLLLGNLPCTSNVEKKDNKTEWDGQHLHYFTLQSLNNLLNQHGLVVQRTLCSGSLNKLRSFSTSLLGADIIVFARKTLAKV
ncbi:MAG: class I SAM-dependent methyltransferase [Dolichospermum sp. DET50]|nr:class I SAM-dependent methyltransferase [Dolichospermum sp. DET66]MBS3035095.1 class I SAM-dependent methyltransferase [Dolichospermum sp. DET67]MBS3040295.1 class I SAM-dependent methyltransferase [Dolichospermum sp. DET50]QSX67453.1 MAG: class I SAM-dependent methyltransferase [Dolichospermum sp. DET69]